MKKMSMKRQGKEIGPAEIYAPPHTMSGEKVSIPAETGAKTSGIKIRGTGAATKGVMARGPMA